MLLACWPPISSEPEFRDFSEVHTFFYLLLPSWKLALRWACVIRAGPGVTRRCAATCWPEIDRQCENERNPGWKQGMISGHGIIPTDKSDKYLPACFSKRNQSLASPIFLCFSKYRFETFFFNTYEFSLKTQE